MSVLTHELLFNYPEVSYLVKSQAKNPLFMVTISAREKALRMIKNLTIFWSKHWNPQNEDDVLPDYAIKILEQRIIKLHRVVDLIDKRIALKAELLLLAA